jgi:hypothetical protein
MIIQSFTWSGVDFVHDFIELILRYSSERHFFGQVLPQQAIKIFIATALPRGMRF